MPDPDPTFLNGELIDQIDWFMSTTSCREAALQFMEDGRRDHYGSDVVAELSMIFWNWMNNDSC